MNSLLIIGAGPGGYECAVKAAKAGLDVHIVDSAMHIGGTCLNEGCIPTKCLCHTAELFEDAKQLTTYGLHLTDAAFNMSAAIERKEQIVSKLKSGIETLLKMPGITFHDGKATFAKGDAHTVNVGGETLTADYVIIATGSQPKFLPIPGAHTAGVVTSTELLNVREVPKRLCIIGGGVIGLEFARIFNTLGAEVSVVEFCKEILPNFDRDIAKRLRLALKKRGINFFTDAPVTAIHRDEEQGELHVSYEQRAAIHELYADLVLMATGRAANVDALNLADVGIDFTPRGIKVDEHMQTNIPGIYAVGDVNGLCQLAHAATAQSMRALHHILGERDNTDLSLVPAAVFTSPEAAMVGLTEEQAKQEYTDAAVHKAFYRSNGRALTMDAADDGLIKIITTATGKLLGAHILGANAAELIHELTAIIALDGTLGDIQNIIHAHPTLSELVQAAAWA